MNVEGNEFRKPARESFLMAKTLPLSGCVDKVEII